MASNAADQANAGLIRLQSLIALAFGLILILSGGGVVWLNHRATLDLLDHQVDHQFDILARGVSAHVEMQLASANSVLNTLATTPLDLIDPDRAAMTLTHVLADLRQVSPAVTRLAMVTEDGRFIESAHVTPTGDDRSVYRLRIGFHSEGDPVETILGLDATFRILSRTSAETLQDPRTASWYRSATAPAAPAAPHPMMMTEGGQNDFVLSRRAAAQPGQVFRLSVRLADLSTILQRAQVFEGEHIALFDDAGMLLGDSSGLALTGPIQAMATRAQAESADARRAWTLNEASLAAYRREPQAQTWMLQGKDGPVHASIAPFNVNGTALIVASSVPTRLFQGPAQRLLYGSLIVQAGVVAIAGIMMAVASRTISRPINTLAVDVERIIAFEFPDRPQAKSRIREIHRLLAAVKILDLTLRALSTYLPPNFVRDLVKEGRAPALGGTRAPVAILFTDIAGFTGIAEGMQPDDLMSQLSRYFTVIGEEVLSSGGTIDKFIGDGLLAFWSLPTASAERVADVCRAVLRAAARVDALNQAFAGEGRPVFATRFGLHVGEALVGSIGTPERMNYTVLGHAVNTAARIEELNKLCGTQVLASGAVRDAVGDSVGLRYIDAAVVRGAQQTVDVYELLPALHSEGASRNAAGPIQVPSSSAT